MKQYIVKALFSTGESKYLVDNPILCDQLVWVSNKGSATIFENDGILIEKLRTKVINLYTELLEDRIVKIFFIEYDGVTEFIIVNNEFKICRRIFESLSCRDLLTLKSISCKHKQNNCNTCMFCYKSIGVLSECSLSSQTPHIFLDKIISLFSIIVLKTSDE